MIVINGALADYKTGNQIDGVISIVRDGVKELELTTVDGGFIVDNLLYTDVITIESEGYAKQTYKVEELDPENINVFMLKKSGGVLPLVLIGGGLYLLSNRKKKVGEMKAGQLLYIGGGVLAFTFLKQILEKFGIWDSAATKELNQDSTDPGSPWSPYYWRNLEAKGVQWSYALPWSTAVSYSNEIYDSFGPINDCEECAIAVFKRLRTKANLSFLCEVFSSTYDQDLLTFLRGGSWPQDRLSDADVNTISQYIKNLPDY